QAAILYRLSSLHTVHCRRNRLNAVVSAGMMSAAKSVPAKSTLHDFDQVGVTRLRQYDLVAFLQGNDRLLPVGRLTGLFGPLPAIFAMHVQSVDFNDLDLEKILNRLPNLGFVRAPVCHDGILIEALALTRPFLCQTHGFDDLKSVHAIP